MSGELVRRSSLSYIIAAAVYFTSSISGIILRFIFQLTGNAFYQQVDFYLPTSAVSALPLLVGQPSIPSDFQSVFRLLSIGTDQTSIPISVSLILIYAAMAIAIARSYFNWADVAKRVA
jgi:hypothetical protein